MATDRNLECWLGTFLTQRAFTTRAEYYIKNTKNSLAQITLAPSVGFASYPENMGNLETKGVELNFHLFLIVIWIKMLIG